MCIRDSLGAGPAMRRIVYSMRARALGIAGQPLAPLGRQAVLIHVASADEAARIAQVALERPLWNRPHFHWVEPLIDNPALWVKLVIHLGLGPAKTADHHIGKRIGLMKLGLALLPGPLVLSLIHIS